MPPPEPLSDTTIAALKELGDIFQKIHDEITAEGFSIRDGKIYPPFKWSKDRKTRIPLWDEVPPEER